MGRVKVAPYEPHRRVSFIPATVREEDDKLELLIQIRRNRIRRTVEIILLVSVCLTLLAYSNRQDTNSHLNTLNHGLYQVSPPPPDPPPPVPPTPPPAPLEPTPPQSPPSPPCNDSILWFSELVDSPQDSRASCEQVACNSHLQLYGYSMLAFAMCCKCNGGVQTEIQNSPESIHQPPPPSPAVFPSSPPPPSVPPPVLPSPSNPVYWHWWLITHPGERFYCCVNTSVALDLSVENSAGYNSLQETQHRCILEDTCEGLMIDARGRDNPSNIYYSELYTSCTALCPSSYNFMNHQWAFAKKSAWSAPSTPPYPPPPSPQIPEDAHRIDKFETCSIILGGVYVSFVNNGKCEDGDTGSVSSVCPYGTDFPDCPVRWHTLPFPPQSSNPPIPPPSLHPSPPPSPPILSTPNPCTTYCTISTRNSLSMVQLPAFQPGESSRSEIYSFSGVMSLEVSSFGSILALSERISIPFGCTCD